MNGEEKLIKTFYDRPLGFTFDQGVTPVHVTKIVQCSKAAELGVRTGMKITGIEFVGQDMTGVEDKSFEETNALLSKGIATLPHETDRPYLAITFVEPETPEELLVKTWYTKPLGIHFMEAEAPIKMTGVEAGSRAWELGVHMGMEIRSIAYSGMPTPADVRTKTYGEAMQLLG